MVSYPVQMQLVLLACTVLCVETVKWILQLSRLKNTDCHTGCCPASNWPLIYKQTSAFHHTPTTSQQQQQQQPFYGPLSRTHVSQYWKKHSLTHTNPDNQLYFISFLHLHRVSEKKLCPLIFCSYYWPYIISSLFSCWFDSFFNNLCTCFFSLTVC